MYKNSRTGNYSARNHHHTIACIYTQSSHHNGGLNYIYIVTYRSYIIFAGFGLKHTSTRMVSTFSCHFYLFLFVTTPFCFSTWQLPSDKTPNAIMCPLPWYVPHTSIITNVSNSNPKSSLSTPMFLADYTALENTTTPNFKAKYL